MKNESILIDLCEVLFGCKYIYFFFAFVVCWGMQVGMIDDLALHWSISF